MFGTNEWTKSTRFAVLISGYLVRKELESALISCGEPFSGDEMEEMWKAIQSLRHDRGGDPLIPADGFDYITFTKFMMKWALSNQVKNQPNWTIEMSRDTSIKCENRWINENYDTVLGRGFMGIHSRTCITSFIPSTSMYKFPSAHRNGCFLHPLILTVKASRKEIGGKGWRQRRWSSEGMLK